MAGEEVLGKWCGKSWVNVSVICPFLMTDALCESSKGTYNLTSTSLLSISAFSNTLSSIQPVMRPARFICLDKHWLPDESVLATFTIATVASAAFTPRVNNGFTKTTFIFHNPEGTWPSEMRAWHLSLSGRKREFLPESRSPAGLSSLVRYATSVVTTHKATH